MAYAEPTEVLLRMAAEVEADAVAALNSGAYDIDAALRSAPSRYSAPVDVESLISEEGIRLAAKLRDINLALAGGILSRGIGSRRGTPDKVRKDYEDAQKWLERVREGKEVLSALVPLAASGSLAVVGGFEWPHTADLLDAARLVS